MPNVHIWRPIYLGHKVVHNANCAGNAFYAGVLQFHLCRQCQLCASDTLFLKLNFHLVNFHLPHIWHCKWHYVSLKYAQQVWFVHCLDQMRSSSGVGESDGRGGELPQVIVKMCHWHFDRMILCWLTGAFDAWCLTCPFCCQFSCQFSFVVDVHQITVWSGMA